MFYDTFVLLLCTALTQSIQCCRKKLRLFQLAWLNDYFAVKMKAKIKTSHLSIAVNELRYFIRLHYFHQKQHLKTFLSITSYKKKMFRPVITLLHLYFHISKWCIWVSNLTVSYILPWSSWVSMQSECKVVSPQITHSCRVGLPKYSKTAH